MAKNESVHYSCDNCGKKLKTSHNSLNIMTSLSSEESIYWSRLHVLIVYRHGMHNDGKEEQADLCKTCAVAILSDALRRVRVGERATAGTEDSSEGKWKS